MHRNGKTSLKHTRMIVKQDSPLLLNFKQGVSFLLKFKQDDVSFLIKLKVSSGGRRECVHVTPRAIPKDVNIERV